MRYAKLIASVVLCGALFFGGFYMGGRDIPIVRERLSRALRDQESLRIANSHAVESLGVLRSELERTSAEANRLASLLDSAIGALGSVGSAISEARGSAEEFDAINRDFGEVLEGILARSGKTLLEGAVVAK